MEAEKLEDLELGHNSLKSLGGSSIGGGDGNGHSSALWPLKSLKSLNLTHNELSEFSFVTLRGLKELRLIDLSNNRIARLYRGFIEVGKIKNILIFIKLTNEKYFFVLLIYIFLFITCLLESCGGRC